MKQKKLVTFNLTMKELPSMEIQKPLKQQKENEENPFKEHSDTDLESENERFMK